MAKYCAICNSFTNCTDNCNKCIEEFENEKKKEKGICENTTI